ncbi:hypothetical protein LR68_04374 [Anoxybacillus sp. BCO1]|nr:hypothetical protein LR68_04374 [Anoxybacillus sp. BCO1]
MTLKEKKNLLKLLRYFAYIDNIDVSNKKTTDQHIATFLYTASNYGYISEQELKPDSRKKAIPDRYAKFIPYSKKTVDEFTKYVFGKILSLKVIPVRKRGK